MSISTLTIEDTDGASEPHTIASPTKRGQTKLQLVKCEQCRKDKQKCLPVGRQWPEKCQRCTDRCFSCSEGRRATWKRRKLVARAGADGSRSPSTGASPSSQLLGNDDSDAIREWVSLISLHRMMTMAIERLQRLKNDMSVLFGISSLDMLRSPDYAESECATFEAFVQDLGTLLLGMARNLLDPAEHHNGSSAVYGLLGHFLSDEYSVAAEAFSLCPVCDIEDSALDILPEQYNIMTDFLARSSRWVKHCRHLEYRPADYSAVEEWERIKEQAREVKSTAIQLLIQLDLADSMPSCPLFVPEEFSLLPEARNTSSKVDCLERTWLHQFLDVRLEVPRSMMEERVLNVLTKNQPILFPTSTIYPDNFIDRQDILGRTALHTACEKGYRSAVSFLLNVNADAGLRTIFGSSPLHYAAAAGFADVCAILLSESAIDVNAKDIFGNTALYYAFSQRQTAVAELLLRNYRTEPNGCGNDGFRPLIFQSIEQGNERCAELLLQRGADPNIRFRNKSAMNFAISQGKPEMVKLLGMAPTVDMNIRRDIGGETPLSLAAFRGLVEAVRYLCTHPLVDLNTRNQFGYTPLMQAARCGHTAVVEVLCSMTCVDLEAMDRVRGWTALDHAQEHGRKSGSWGTAEHISNEFLKRQGGKHQYATSPSAMNGI